MDEKKQVITKFVKDNSEMITACFDEYYFIIPEGVIKPDVSKASTYKIGDAVPVAGETYTYPQDFNIIDLHYKKVAQIRGARLNDIVNIDDFEYDGLPAYNMMGFYINIFSASDFEQFKDEFRCFSIVERAKLAAFASKWFDIIKNKRIKYR